MTILHSVIHFAKAEEMEQVGAGFSHLASGGASGDIDRCPIHILPPAEPQRKSFINRKCFPSIALQGVCEAKGAFLDVCVGNAGSVHDALVLRRSPVYKQAVYPPAGFFLLRDGEDPCLKHPIYIVTPYWRPVAIVHWSFYLQSHCYIGTCDSSIFIFIVMWRKD